MPPANAPEQVPPNRPARNARSAPARIAAAAGDAGGGRPGATKREASREGHAYGRHTRRATRPQRSVAPYHSGCCPAATAARPEHAAIWDPVFSALPSGPDDPRHIENPQLDLDELRPLPPPYYAYDGSLTTPPCSEGVEWLVLAEKRQLSPEQMATITSHLHHNNRPVQPLGDRELLLVSTE